MVTCSRAAQVIYQAEWTKTMVSPLATSVLQRPKAAIHLVALSNDKENGTLLLMAYAPIQFLGHSERSNTTRPRSPQKPLDAQHGQGFVQPNPLPVIYAKTIMRGGQLMLLSVSMIWTLCKPLSAPRLGNYT